MSVVDIDKYELRKLIKSGRAEIVDVRERSEFEIIRIRDSKLIPMNELMSRLNDIDWSKEVVFVCRSGSRSALMANLVAQEKEIKNLKYGIHECFVDGEGKNLEVDEELVKQYF